MNKKLKKTVFIISALFLAYAVYFFGDYAINGHHTKGKEKWKEYMFFFNDSIKSDLDIPLFAYSEEGKKDIFTSFIYRPGLSLREKTDYPPFHPTEPRYNIIIWQFKELSQLEVPDVKFRFDEPLDHLKLKRGEILNSNSEQKVAVKYNPHYTDMTIHVDDKSEIINPSIGGNSYRGFMGNINRMSFSNENNVHDIYIDYDPSGKQVILLVTKQKGAFYIVIIISTEHFDENIIKILNLD